MVSMNKNNLLVYQLLKNQINCNYWDYCIYCEKLENKPKIDKFSMISIKMNFAQTLFKVGMDKIISEERIE